LKKLPIFVFLLTSLLNFKVWSDVTSENQILSTEIIGTIWPSNCEVDVKVFDASKLYEIHSLELDSIPKMEKNISTTDRGSKKFNVGFAYSNSCTEGFLIRSGIIASGSFTDRGGVSILKASEDYGFTISYLDNYSSTNYLRPDKQVSPFEIDKQFNIVWFPTFEVKYYKLQDNSFTGDLNAQIIFNFIIV
tara:strand:+ start:5038 stop:5610 length:573 start_codon:yes stop_codon:yes gene_type:complete